jgi:hypothetical protein
LNDNKPEKNKDIGALFGSTREYEGDLNMNEKIIKVMDRVYAEIAANFNAKHFPELRINSRLLPFLSLILIVSIFLAACAPVATVVPATETPVNTATPTITATATATSTPNPTPTPTEAPLQLPEGFVVNEEALNQFSIPAEYYEAGGYYILKAQIIGYGVEKVQIADEDWSVGYYEILYIANGIKETAKIYDFLVDTISGRKLVIGFTVSEPKIGGAMYLVNTDIHINFIKGFGEDIFGEGKIIGSVITLTLGVEQPQNANIVGVSFTGEMLRDAGVTQAQFDEFARNGDVNVFHKDGYLPWLAASK